MNQADPKLPLTGVRVLDLSRLFPGPFCSMILADFGAEVFCIEDRRFEKDLGGLPTIMRNKRHITLNLKTEEGRAIFFRLLEEADVVLDGFRPGVLDRLGIGYEAARAKNPRIIYCAITGYGQTGPYSEMVGHDINYGAIGGFLEQNGSDPDGPPAIPGVQVADVAGGGMNGAIGVLLALAAREKSGEGQFVDISMTDGVVSMLGMAAGFKWILGTEVGRGDGMLTGKYPWYRVYRCKDGRYFSVGSVEHRFWSKLVAYFGRPEWEAHQYDDAKLPEMHAFFEECFAEKTSDTWWEELRGEDFCVGKVQNISEVLDDPHVKARGMVREIQDGDKTIPLLGNPIKLSATPARIDRPPAGFGQHTEEVLVEFGYTAAQVAGLRERGVI